MDLDHLYVFSLEVTGVHDLKHLEASKVCQHRKMFKLVIHIDKENQKDRAQYPQLFEGKAERESQKKKGNNETMVQLEVSNDGSINLLKTSFKDNQANKALTSKDMKKFKITSKIITVQKQEGDSQFSTIVYDNEVTFENCLLLQNQNFYDK